MAGNSSVFALIAGGGTGGHVNPALAVADALVDHGHERDSVQFVGSSRGLESELVPAAGYKITLLPGRGIARRLTLDNAGAIAGLLVALVRAVILVAKVKPRVVVSVGGYASAPCSLAAVLLRVPLILVESNAVPGAANRLVARFAKASAVALPSTPLPKSVVTGNPVRSSIAAVDRSVEGRKKARTELGLPAGVSLVGAFGGSLGALTINRAVFELADLWQGRDDVAIRHAVGKRDWVDASLQRPESANYFPVEYEDRMSLLMSAVDVLICRAGATTVAEVTAAGVPAVFVPLPNAPGDHQTANARALESAGAAVLIRDDECTGERLDTVLTSLLEDEQRLQSMWDASRSLAVPDAAQRVADLVESHAST